MHEQLEALGWEFYPVAPEEWKYLKVFDNKIIAVEGDEVWKKDLESLDV